MLYISWLYVLESVVIITGNVITIVIFTTTLRLRSRQYALIVSLAVADLLVGLISLPMEILFLESYLRKVKTFSTVYFMQDVLFGIASLFGLVALATERLHATFFPFKHSAMSNVPYVIGIALVWVLAIGIGMGSFAGVLNFTAYLVIKVAIVLISLIIITTAYLLIYLKVHCYVTQNNLHSSRSNKKLTVTLAIVTIISLIAWAPYQYIIVYAAVNTRLPTALYSVRRLTKFLHFGNSLANFFVYAFRMRDFKSELIRRFTCKGTQISSRGDSVELGSSLRQNTNTRMNASVVCDKNV